MRVARSIKKMKTHAFCLLALLPFLITSCGDEEAIKPLQPSVSIDGVLSGEIEDYYSGDVDSIVAYGPSSSIIGSCNVTSSGGFNMNPRSPSSTMQIRGYLFDGFEGSVSNEISEISNVILLCFKGGQIIGRLSKCNYPIDQTSENVGTSIKKSILFGKVGSAYSDILYCSSPVTIEGSAVAEVLLPVSAGYYMDRRIYDYDISLKRGWNEVVLKYSKYSTSMPAYIFNLKYSNRITDDLKWRIFGLEAI